MTPQAGFMVLAAIREGRVPEMRSLLASICSTPGVADATNALVPFGALEKLHFARFIVLEDQTLGDLSAYGVRRPAPPVYLAFLGDFDGDYTTFVQELVGRAGAGLRRIFGLCEGFEDGTELVQWMTSRETGAASYYCNWVGRTVTQCREEERLRLALRAYIGQSTSIGRRVAAEVRDELVEFVRTEKAAGRLTLTPDARTPVGWCFRHTWYAVLLGILALGGLVTLPLTILPLLGLALVIRRLEVSDPVIAPRPEQAWEARLSALEDQSVTNQFSAMGTIKPGVVRRCLLWAVLWLVNLAAHLIYTKGRLARVSSIHFARWVYLDGGTRVFFASNYDGSLGSYMDEFINKVGFGLNAAFSNGIGYPRTKWLVLDGADDEQHFKYFLRRHQLPTDVWYQAVPGLTAIDLQRNHRIRQGIEAQNMAPEESEEWLALL
jgi:hypothetical protein